MKWPKTQADLLSEKTFLVLREDLKTIGEKGPAGAEAEDEAAAGTWPKMRKRRPRKGATESSDSEEPRPATASLEAPLVLDPRLVDKLDMSLLSKESFNASVTRINLSLVKSVTIMDNPIKSSAIESAKANHVHNNNNFIQPKSRPRLMAPRSGRKGSVDSSESATTTNSSSSSAAEGASSPEGGGKRFDDNNNKNNKTSVASHQQQLSPLRSRSSRSSLSSSDVALFTSNPCAITSKKKAEPCKACGRAAQPERFHSHPKSPTSSPTKEKEPALNSARSTLSVIPVRGTRTSLQRKASARQELQQQIPGGVPDNRRRANSPTMAEKLASVTPTRKQGKILIDENNKKERNEDPPSLSEDKSTASISKRRPRTVTCYICGREFGSASFPIHEPKCLERWNRENKALPSSQRREPPQRPTVPIDHEDWNTAAWEQSQALLIPCPKCKRTFLPDRLAIHERNCRVPNKANATNNNNSNTRINAKNPTDPSTAAAGAALGGDTSTGSTPRNKPGLPTRRSPKDNHHYHHPDAQAVKRQGRGAGPKDKNNVA